MFPDGFELLRKQISGIFAMRACAAGLLTVAYVIVLVIVYVIHVWFFNVNVVFYSAILDAMISCAILAALSLFIGARLPIDGFSLSLLVVIWALGGYGFAISGPALFDRSLSFYILEKLQQRGGGILKLRMGDVFREEYMPEFRLIDVRLTEQLQSGTIAIENGCVKLTPRGERLATLGRFVRTTLMPKHRLLMGVYTDALVDPFRGARRDRSVTSVSRRERDLEFAPKSRRGIITELELRKIAV